MCHYRARWLCPSWPTLYLASVTSGQHLTKWQLTISDKITHSALSTNLTKGSRSCGNSLKSWRVLTSIRSTSNTNKCTKVALIWSLSSKRSWPTSDKHWVRLWKALMSRKSNQLVNRKVLSISRDKTSSTTSSRCYKTMLSCDNFAASTKKPCFRATPHSQSLEGMPSLRFPETLSRSS